MSLRIGWPTITVDVQDEVVRVVVLQGREVVAWGTAAIGEEAVRHDHEAPQKDEPAAQLRALLEELPSRRGRLVTSLPLSIPLLRRLHLPKIGRRYLRPVVLSEVLETIPFSEDEVDITWQDRRTGRGHEVLATAVPREAIDRHITLLREAGRPPAAAYPRATALALAVGVPDVIIVDLSLPSVAIVLVQGGVPMVVHQVQVPERDAGPEERADVAARAVEQVLNYHQGLGGGEDHRQRPVVLTGPLAKEGVLAEALETVLDGEVLPFSPFFAGPEHFPAHEYAANLGLAQAWSARARLPVGLFRRRRPSINLLPERHRFRPLPVLPVAVFATLLLFGYVAFGVTAQVNATVSHQTRLSSRVTNLERQERSHTLSLGRADVLEERIAATARLRRELAFHLAGLGQELETLLAQLEMITGEALPPQVRLSTVTRQEVGFVLAGTASTYEDVMRYSANLRAPGVLTETRVLRVETSGATGESGPDQEGAAEAIPFQIKASVASAPDAESAPGSRRDPSS